MTEYGDKHQFLRPNYAARLILCGKLDDFTFYFTKHQIPSEVSEDSESKGTVHISSIVKQAHGVHSMGKEQLLEAIKKGEILVELNSKAHKLINRRSVL
jgi:hypothetical protein